MFRVFGFPPDSRISLCIFAAESLLFRCLLWIFLSMSSAFEEHLIYLYYKVTECCFSSMGMLWRLDLSSVPDADSVL